MASVKFTFWYNGTTQESYQIPYIGDITNNPDISGVPGFVEGFGVGSGGGVTKYVNYTEAGRRGINLLSSSNYFIGLNNQMTSGFQVEVREHYLYGTCTRVSAQLVGSYANGSNVSSEWTNRTNRGSTTTFTLALATINGITTIGFLVGGSDVATGELESAAFFTNINENSVFRRIYDNSQHKGDWMNPYSQAGYNNKPKGGNDSNFSEDSDLVPIGDLPDETISAIGSGFSTLFAPTKAQLRHLQGVMWGDSIVNFFQNMVENIGSMFVSLGIVPFNVPKGNTVSVKWFGLVDTAISLTLAAQQWIRVDMGSVIVGADNKKIFTTDTALDYTPYCKLGIYLPFIGFQDLDIDECRKAPLHLYYDIDLMSGACIAKIEVAGSILYQFSGNCLSQIPLSSQDAQTLFTNAVNIGLAVSGVGTTAAVAGAGDAVAAGESLSASEASLGEAKRAAQVSSAESKLASCTANAAIGMKPNYTRTGAVGGPCAMLAEKTPYLYLRTSRQSMPEGYEKVCGFPCNMYGNLSTFSGYTVVEDIRLNHLVATAGEVEEIYKLLKSGVII